MLNDMTESRSTSKKSVGKTAASSSKKTAAETRQSATALPAPAQGHSPLPLNVPESSASASTAEGSAISAKTDPDGPASVTTLSTLAVADSQYLNRELSWLSFNERVLAEAKDERNPLLERLKYAAICGSNLDEFFMVRIAGIHRQIAAHVTTPSLDGLTPQASLYNLRNTTHIMQRSIENATSHILQGLAEQDVYFSHVAELDSEVADKVRSYYLDNLHLVLTPLIVDQSHPFPYISNLSLNIGVRILSKNCKGTEFVRLKVPVGSTPRVVNIDGHLLLIEEIIASQLDTLFKGREIVETCIFRVTRNTDWDFDEEEADDLLVTIADGLLKRRFGQVVRLEIDSRMSKEMREFLVHHLEVAEEDIMPLRGPLGLADLMGLPVERPDLSFASYVPVLNKMLKGDNNSIFEVLRQQDIILHHPYDSFGGVLNLLEEAARDPRVAAIKQTLYRTGDDPRLLSALQTAAENGKQVVAMIELKARFDEKSNIEWAKKLEQAGAHVVYGIPGLKIHAKTLLIVRREEDRMRCYTHLGTGNYNPKTARLYTDLSLMTSSNEIGADASELFNHLTASIDAEYSQLLVAPETARSGLLALIDREIAQAKAGKEAYILGKCNQLTDPRMIHALYAASQAGVQIDFVVRGVCCLRPGVAGLSENIRIHSLLGRYLEHARIYVFGNAGQPAVYFGSADLMNRNLKRRVEVIAPVLDEDHRQTFVRILETELADQRGSWQLLPTGEYQKLVGERSAQRIFADQRQP